MPGIERFEDLIAWQKARELARSIYNATKDAPFAKDYDLARQIQRAAVSVMTNIAERFERQGVKEFRRFFLITKASCAEVRSLLYVAGDLGYLSSETLHKLLAQADEVARIVTGLRNSLDRNQQKGPR